MGYPHHLSTGPTLSDGLNWRVEEIQKMMPFNRCPLGSELIEKNVEKLLRGEIHTAALTVRAEGNSTVANGFIR